MRTITTRTAGPGSLPASELSRLAMRFPQRHIKLGGDVVVAAREHGDGPAMVCLHGIGSGAASWLDVAQRLGEEARVIAWDAPGYGDSTPLPQAQPSADHYAERLKLLVDALELESFVLVGHSLGAIMAAAAARRGTPLSRRIRGLLLLNPATGYGAPDRSEAAQRTRHQRLATLRVLGVSGMAAQRSGRLLSSNASDLARQWARWTMGQLHEQGYRQAVELLCRSDLLELLPPAGPVRVACGELDMVTTPQACAAVARRCQVPLDLLSETGHASPVEQPGQVAALLSSFARSC